MLLPCHRNGHWGSLGSSRNSGCSQRIESPFFSFPFLPFGSSNVQTLLVQGLFIAHEGYPNLAHTGISQFSQHHPAQVTLPVGASPPSAGHELLLSPLPGHCRCHSPWATTAGGRDFRAVWRCVTSLSHSSSSSLSPPGVQHEARQSQRIKTP